MAAAGLVCACFTPRAAHTQPVDAKTAARELVEGQRAFAAGDFQHAAEQFEAAYRYLRELQPTRPIATLPPPRCARSRRVS